MKILSVSDYVVPSLQDPADAKSHPDVDLILSCGDLPPEYLSHLSRSLDAPVYYVRGNHDIRYDSGMPEGCIDLNARLMRFQDIAILGLSGSRWYNGGPHQYTEAQMRKTIRRLRFTLWWRGGPDIIVTHAPPRHIHDAEDLCHRGFKCFRQLIGRYSPAYFLHGHIHRNFDDPSQRITTLNQTKVVNCYGHFLFDISPEEAAEKT